MEEKEVKETEKTYTMNYTTEEVAQELQSLENDEEMQLFLKVQAGAVKYNKYTEFMKIMQRIQNKKP